MESSQNPDPNQLANLFARTRDAFKSVSGIISEGTGRKRLTADQWISGRRTPGPEVLAQIARNLRRRAVLLQALAAEFDQHAADGVRAAASTRSKASMEGPRSASANMSQDDQVEQAETGPNVEVNWSHESRRIFRRAQFVSAGRRS